MDMRIQQLAENLIRYSTDLQPGEKILIECFDCAHPLAEALVEEAYKVGNQGGKDRVAGLADTHCAKINTDGIKCSFC